MFIDSLVSKIKTKLWGCFLPRFTSKDCKDDRVYNYYGVYFSDVKQEKYQLVKLIGKSVVLEKWNAEQHAYVARLNTAVSDIEKMNVEIIHWKKYGPLRFDSIVLFAINYLPIEAGLSTSPTFAILRITPSFFSLKSTPS